MIKTFTMAAVAAALAFGAAPATAAVTTATSSGWINDAGSDNSGGFGTGIHNNFAGLEVGVYRNWFEFTLPTTTFTTATISIFNTENNRTIDPDAIFTLHAATDFSFSGLVNSPSFGSVSLVAANTGTDHYVTISLNSLGIDYLNANLGSTIRFGGMVTSTADPSCNDCVTIFGSTNGNPAAHLITVSEPARWALLIAGFGLVGVAARRRRAVAAA